MAETVGIGVLGCGNTSKAYFELVPKFRGLEIRACADLNREVAQIRAQEYNVRAETVHDLLIAEDIDLIVNLTLPDAHGMMIREILNHDKHVYSEKPLARTLEEGEAMMKLAKTQHLQIGCAPDTFMGGAWQTARKAIDDGMIGRVVGGTCHAMNSGMEAWHPNPDVFFKSGGGPMLDLGPYYIGCLLNLIGPVLQVSAMSATPRKLRKIACGPRTGETIEVETPTTVHSILAFETGALVSFLASWDVQAHAHAPMELYGTEGTLFLPDPVFFGGDVVFVSKTGERQALDHDEHPFSRPNFSSGGKPRANYRAAGLADMVRALHSNDEFRCTIDRALHSVEVIEAIQSAAASGAIVRVDGSVVRPEPLPGAKAKDLLLQ